MEKKIYMHPLNEVTKVNPSCTILGGSPGVKPVPPHPAPARGASPIE